MLPTTACRHQMLSTLVVNSGCQRLLHNNCNCCHEVIGKKRRQRQRLLPTNVAPKLNAKNGWNELLQTAN